MEPNLTKIEGLVRQLLIELGEDANREAWSRRTERVAKALKFLTQGYRADVRTVINQALFTQTTGGMVIVKDIELYSLCEHHMLPVLRPLPHRLHPERPGVRRLQARAPGRRVRAAPAAAGAHHRADLAGGDGGDRRDGRRRG